MPVLNTRNIALLPENVQRPQYDRESLTPGIVHLGSGAFHRTHLMDFHEDTLEHQFGAWGVIGINLRAPDIGAVMTPQEGLYCRQLRFGKEYQTRLIGGLLAGKSVSHLNEPLRRKSVRKALEIIDAPEIKVVSMTVTEKGYCHTPSTGLLQEDHPDIVHDIKYPRYPLSVPGFVLEIIQMRLCSDQIFPTFISCDNVPANGKTLKNCVLKLAEQVCPNLVPRIANEVIFLSTMVDRIVPATRKIDISKFKSWTGVSDAALVVGEPYRMWVIEDDKRAQLPAWHEVGALIINNVHDYELVKMRVVNGMQTSLTHLGHLSNFKYMSDVFGNEIFREFGRTLIMKEVLPNLPQVKGIVLKNYVNETVDRLMNPAIKHRTAQISTDGSQKIRHRLLDPLHDSFKTGIPKNGLTISVAAWLVHIFELGGDVNQKEISDPFLSVAIRVRKASKNNLSHFIDELIKERTVFPQWLNEIPNLIGEIKAIADQIQKQHVDKILREYLSNH